MNVADWRKEISQYFPEFVVPAEMGLSVFGQLLIEDVKNPFGLVYVDVPSSGKTITLNFFSDFKERIYLTDSFTAASFVSHAANVKKEKLHEIDLLPRIKDKVFIVRDFATIFGMKDDDLLRTMGVLTRVFDGEGLSTDSAIHGQRDFSGEHLFMFLAASTPIRTRVWKVMGNFGSRLFFLLMNTPDKSTETLVSQVSSKFSVRMKEKKCREATTKLLTGLFKKGAVTWNRKNDDRELLMEIATMAQLVACLRGVINVWKDNFDDDVFHYTDPQIEKPDRINQLFYNLARGHALVCGATTIDDEDVAIVLQVALSSASIERVKFLKILLKHDGILTTDIVMDELVFSRTTALKLMTIFCHLDIVEDTWSKKGDLGRSDRKVKIVDKFSWFTSPRFKELQKLLQA